MGVCPTLVLPCSFRTRAPRSTCSGSTASVSRTSRSLALGVNKDGQDSVSDCVYLIFEPVGPGSVMFLNRFGSHLTLHNFYIRNFHHNVVKKVNLHYYHFPGLRDLPWELWKDRAKAVERLAQLTIWCLVYRGDRRPINQSLHERKRNSPEKFDLNQKNFGLSSFFQGLNQQNMQSKDRNGLRAWK